MNAHMFARLTKVDAEKRLVFGRLAEEVADKSDEIMDYASSKPYFKAWSDEFAKDTDGKSLGALRAMHGKVAAGKFIEINYDDVGKTVDVVAKVIDDNEWTKVLEGVYRGFSIGGSYVGEKKVEKIDDRDVKRYTAKPSEGSLVDSPCMHGAKFFEVQKADGTLAKVDFKEPEENPVTSAIEKLDEIEGGTVEGTPDQVDELTKIMAEKGLSLADIITFAKGDVVINNVAVGGEVDAATQAQIDLAKAADTAPDGCSQEKWDAMTAAEKKAYLADAAAKVAGEAALVKLEAALADPLVKVGARNSATDKGRLNAIHSAAVDLGADCSAAKVEPTAELQKMEADALTKLVADAIEPLQKALDDANGKIKKLEEQPAAPRVSLRAVTKAEDTGAITVGPTEADLVKDAHGVVHPAASLIKQAISEGGKPLLYRG